jgi:uncharacterized protein YuzE
MRITFDPKNNVGYIYLQAKTEQVETIRVSEEMNVDLAPDGTIYGIELLNANEQLAGEDGGLLVVIDEARGKLAEVDLGLGTRR